MRNLTPREIDMAELLIKGERNQVIADELGIGIETVKTYVQRMLQKFDVRNRTEFAVKYDRERRA